MKRFFNPVSLLQTFIALVLVAACLFAAQWQFNRGGSQSATNKIIAANNKIIEQRNREAIEEKKHHFSALTSSYAQFLVFERKYFQLLIDEFDLALPYFELKKAEFNELLQKVQPNYATL